MTKTFFHSYKRILILAVLVSLLVVSGVSRANASISSFTIHSTHEGPYPEAKKADAQQSFPDKAVNPSPLVGQANIIRPESASPSSEIRQSGTLNLGQPSKPGDEWKPAPGRPVVELKPAPLDPESAPVNTVEPVVQAGWSTIMTEGFEGAFPTGLWSTFDNDGATNGEFYWGADDYKPFSGTMSAWPARGGANGLDPQSYYYPNYAMSWMMYGPFDLSDASYAELLFYYWNRSETDRDYFGWYASTNGTNFYGTYVSGDSGGWLYVDFDLTSVPNLGNVTGSSSVWIAFVFTSDGSNVDDGPFVDDILLQKYSQPSQPNLSPYTPNGWDYPIVPSATTGTNTVSTLYADQNTYIDWAVVNVGAATSTTFISCLYYDNTQIQCWDWTGGLDQNYYVYVQDWILNLTPTPGSHTLKIIVDVNNSVTESNESDNTWEMSFTWNGATQPNLTPFTPTGWDYPIVPSSATGTHYVSRLFTTQNTYIDWAVINRGVNTSTTFVNCLYFDNSQVNCWNTTGGLNQDQYAYVEDWILNLSPTVGAHSLKIVADVNNAITESNESDNTWEQSFSWNAFSYQIYLPLLLRNFSTPTNQTLTVSKNGAGSGTVTSNPSGINCGATCSYAFVYNTVVTLTAAPTSLSTFDGWSGAGCSGTGTCAVTMSSAQSVTATFNAYFEGPWEVEPNNTYLQANGPLHSGANYNGYPNDQKDYFSFLMLNNGPIVVKLSNHTGSGVQLQLFYQSTDDRVAVDLNAPYQINYTGKAGWYYVYIYTASGYNSNTAYTLQVTYP